MGPDFVGGAARDNSLHLFDSDAIGFGIQDIVTQDLGRERICSCEALVVHFQVARWDANEVDDLRYLLNRAFCLSIQSEEWLSLLFHGDQGGPITLAHLIQLIKQRLPIPKTEYDMIEILAGRSFPELRELNRLDLPITSVARSRDLRRMWRLAAWICKGHFPRLINAMSRARVLSLVIVGLSLLVLAAAATLWQIPAAAKWIVIVGCAIAALRTFGVLSYGIVAGSRTLPNRVVTFADFISEIRRRQVTKM